MQRIDEHHCYLSAAIFHDDLPPTEIAVGVFCLGFESLCRCEVYVTLLELNRFQHVE